VPWIRLSDNYIEDEKFLALSDRSFRLWHEAMAYCRRHQTDGLIPFAILRGFRAYSKTSEKQLASPARDGLAPLWELIPATGYKVHNYLNWNLSKEEENNERAGAAARMRKFRARGSEETSYGVTDGVTNGVTPTVTNGEVPDRIGKDLSCSSLEEKKRPESEVLFDRFWAAYPRKVGKDAAWKAWQKRRPDADGLEAILAALAWQSRSSDWLKDGGQFIPHPSTWLNQARWHDEPRRSSSVNSATIAVVNAVEEFLRT
jgi:hypothetical protein